MKNPFKREPREEFRCPRRDEAFGADERFPGPDTWNEGSGLVHQKRGCSYCGSMNPEDFVSALEAGYTVEPTDKSYKLYLGGIVDDVAMQGKFYTPHFSLETAARFIKLYQDGGMKIGYPGRFYTRLNIPFDSAVIEAKVRELR